MAAYGIQIFNDKNQSMGDLYPGNFVIDSFPITSGAAGSKTYSLAAGETLKFNVVGMLEATGVGNFRVSGGTVAWDRVTNGLLGVAVVIKTRSQ